MRQFGSKLSLIIPLVILITQGSMGHPGHGHIPEGANHYLMEPYHILPVILIIAALILVFRVVMKYSTIKKKK